MSPWLGGHPKVRREHRFRAVFSPNKKLLLFLHPPQDGQRNLPEGHIFPGHDDLQGVERSQSLIFNANLASLNCFVKLFKLCVSIIITFCF